MSGDGDRERRRERHLRAESLFHRLVDAGEDEREPELILGLLFEIRFGK